MSKPKTTEINTVAIIPVRGGSRGIPRKNARLLNGKPLLAYSIETCLKASRIDRVYVSTDDPELSEIAHRFGAFVLPRPEALAKDHVGLDEVICDAVATIEKKEGIRIDQVVTVQATCPLLNVCSIDTVCKKQAEEKYDTVLTVVNDTHLGWEREPDGILRPLYKARINRQLLPPHFRETGGIVACSRRTLDSGSRFGKNVGILEISKTEAIDIDDFFDWWMAEKSLKRKRICFHVIGNREYGLGHVYRALTLADRLIDHDLFFLVNENSSLAAELIQRRFYPLVVVSPGSEAEALIQAAPDLVINDVLDTSSVYMQVLQQAGIATINFEDIGPGSLLADRLINAMYEDHPARADENTFHGTDYCCLRDEFYSIEPIQIRNPIQNVLLLFGGTDPNSLAVKCLGWIDSFEGDWTVTAIIGAGHHDPKSIQVLASGAHHRTEIIYDTSIISRYMAQADIAVTSAGRTVFELASLGVPMLVVAQNEREMTHTFAQQSPGVIFCGRGDLLEKSQFQSTFEELVGSPLLREKMSAALTASEIRKGIDRVLEIIHRTLDPVKAKEQTNEN